MAFDGYRSSLPLGGRPEFLEPSNQRPQYSAGYPPQYPLDPQEVRPRASSIIPPDARDATRKSPPPAQPGQPQSQPVNEAVSSTANKASASTSQYPPDLVAQITADVLARLQAAGQENNVVPPPPPASYPPPPSVRSDSETSISPTMASRGIHTPPSPHQTQRAETSNFDSAPPFAAAPGPVPLSPREPSGAPSNDKSMPSPGSDASSVGSGSARPKVSRLSTDKEQTPLERFWGALFNEDGHPTARLGQFLRGVANHIICDYEPCQSIVVTPAKMLRYYQETKIPNEIYQWCTTFNKSNSTISKMYRDLECQQHLVQNRSDEVPTIPGLTPVGFEKWMETLILAHPDKEFERLQNTVLDMPISNADNAKERFPKEISRRLFPTTEERATRERFERAVGAEKVFEPPKIRKTETMNVPRSEPRTNTTSAPPPNILNLERERNPYSGTPSESAIDDTPLPPSNIERERKPYSSQPGNGKTFDEPLKAPIARPARANSMSKPRPIPINTTGRPDGSPYPDNRHHRASSTVNATGPPRRRPRSPSFSAGPDFRRPGEDVHGYQPPGSLPRDPRDIEEENRRYTREAEQKRADWARRQAEEDARSYDTGRDIGRDRDLGRDRYDKGSPDVSSLPNGPPRRGYEDDYYRSIGRGGAGGGYDYNQQYPPAYR
ncbi:MAG: hypothetical protein M1835_007588 [Candelina submexicana]|nr:MAG: hypothetical protein M1835_007588 [Candelina submexicana]